MSGDVNTTNTVKTSPAPPKEPPPPPRQSLPARDDKSAARGLGGHDDKSPAGRGGAHGAATYGSTDRADKHPDSPKPAAQSHGPERGADAGAGSEKPNVSAGRTVEAKGFSSDAKRAQALPKPATKDPSVRPTGPAVPRSDQGSTDGAAKGKEAAHGQHVLPKPGHGNDHSGSDDHGASRPKVPSEGSKPDPVRPVGPGAGGPQRPDVRSPRDEHGRTPNAPTKPPQAAAPKTPDAHAPKAPDAHAPKQPDTKDPKSDAKTPDAKTSEPQRPEQKTPDHTTDPKTPEQKTPEHKTDPKTDPKTPDPTTPDPKTPDPKTPDPKTPHPKTQDAKTPDAKAPDPKTPDAPKPAPTPVSGGPIADPARAGAGQPALAAPRGAAKAEAEKPVAGLGKTEGKLGTPPNAGPKQGPVTKTGAGEPQHQLTPEENAKRLAAVDKPLTKDWHDHAAQAALAIIPTFAARTAIGGALRAIGVREVLPKVGEAAVKGSGVLSPTPRALAAGAVAAARNGESAAAKQLAADAAKKFAAGKVASKGLDAAGSAIGHVQNAANPGTPASPGSNGQGAPGSPGNPIEVNKLPDAPGTKANPIKVTDLPDAPGTAANPIEVHDLPNASSAPKANENGSFRPLPKPR